jgi:hypothetical protein
MIHPVSVNGKALCWLLIPIRSWTGRYGTNPAVLLVCGPGNNGGDTRKTEIIGGKGNTFLKWHRCWHRFVCTFFLVWEILGKYVMMFCMNVVIWRFARSFRAPYRSMTQPVLPASVKNHLRMAWLLPDISIISARAPCHGGYQAVSRSQEILWSCVGWQFLSTKQLKGMAEAETGHSPTVPMDFFRVPTSQIIDHAVFWFVVNMHSCCRSDREPFPHRFQIELWQIHFSTLTGSQ